MRKASRFGQCVRFIVALESDLRLGALEGGVPPPFQCLPAAPPPPIPSHAVLIAQQQLRVHVAGAPDPNHKLLPRVQRPDLRHHDVVPDLQPRAQAHRRVRAAPGVVEVDHAGAHDEALRRLQPRAEARRAEEGHRQRPAVEGPRVEAAVGQPELDGQRPLPRHREEQLRVGRPLRVAGVPPTAAAGPGPHAGDAQALPERELVERRPRPEQPHVVPEREPVPPLPRLRLQPRHLLAGGRGPGREEGVARGRVEGRARPGVAEQRDPVRRVRGVRILRRRSADVAHGV